MPALIGTASWTDPSLIKAGTFYPKGTKTAEGRLRYYAEQFPIVEVDSSYYAMPSARNSALWAERTPETFRFNVKAFRLFTGHQTSPDALPKDVRAALGPVDKKFIYYRDVPRELLDELWGRFTYALEPLRQAGKLVALHFQFAPWVTRVPKSLAHITECRERLADYTIAVEFRHRSWFEAKHRDETLAFEREHKLTHVIVDEPQGFENSIPPVWEVTTPSLAVVRMHGRNKATWNAKGLEASSDRFNYDYSHQVLEEIAESVKSLSEKVEQTHVIFNNNFGDQGQRNAKTLMSILDVDGD